MLYFTIKRFWFLFGFWFLKKSACLKLSITDGPSGQLSVLAFFFLHLFNICELFSFSKMETDENFVW